MRGQKTSLSPGHATSVLLRFLFFLWWFSFFLHACAWHVWGRFVWGWVSWIIYIVRVKQNTQGWYCGYFCLKHGRYLADLGDVSLIPCLHQVMAVFLVFKLALSTENKQLSIQRPFHTFSKSFQHVICSLCSEWLMLYLHYFQPNPVMFPLERQSAEHPSAGRRGGICMWYLPLLILP